MALGQLTGGPVSDQRGRRRPLIVAILVFIVASVACALAPSVGVMMVARFVQGFAGAVVSMIGLLIVARPPRQPQ
nr:hypothetical protein GCM10020063_033430 [Dactylosporangium thailandense]